MGMSYDNGAEADDYLYISVVIGAGLGALIYLAVVLRISARRRH
jgi:hypothetical protein